MLNEKAEKLSFIEKEELDKINEISRKILRQVFDRLDCFIQEYIFDFDEDENYYSPSDLVICLSPDEYCFLEKYFK